MNQYEIWKPLAHEGIPNELYIDAIHQDAEGFRILIGGRNELGMSIFRLKFESYIGYRNFDESYRLMSLDKIPVSCREWGLFKTTDSSFINWIIEESGGRYSKGELLHFIVVTQNDIVDVIALEEPIVEELV